MSAQTRRKVLRRMIEGWPAVLDAAEKLKLPPSAVAKKITTKLPWHLMEGGTDTQRAAKVAFAVNQEAKRLLAS